MCAIPCSEEFACGHGYYPYCPFCDYGYVRVEEWMREDECEWVCLLDKDDGGES